MNKSVLNKYVLGNYYYSKYWNLDGSDTISTWVYKGTVEVDSSASRSELSKKHRFQLQLREDSGGELDDFQVELSADELGCNMLTEDELLKSIASFHIVESKRRREAEANGHYYDAEPKPVDKKDSYLVIPSSGLLNRELKNSNDLKALLSCHEPLNLLFEYQVSANEIELLSSFTQNLGLSFYDITHLNVFELKPLAGKKNIRSLFVPNSSKPLSEFLNWLESLSALEVLDLLCSKITDEVGGCLKNLSNLQVLKLQYTKITDQLRFDLQECTKLTNLELSNTKITDQFFDLVKPWPLLTELRLNGTSISDGALQSLKHFPQLSSLSLENTELTDQSLPILKQMQQLTFLNIQQTNISFQGALDLIHSLENCYVYC